MNLVGCILFGISIGRHFGVFDGIAAAFALYALMPYAVSFTWKR